LNAIGNCKLRRDTPISAVSITNPHTIAPQAGAHMSSFIVRRMAFFNSTLAKSGWYHNMTLGSKGHLFEQFSGEKMQKI